MDARESNRLLFHACQKGDLAAIKRCILEDGVDVNARPVPPPVPRHLSVRLGKGSGKRIISLKWFASVARCEETAAGAPVRDSPLHVAAKFGHTDPVRLLLDCEARVDAVNVVWI